MLEARLASRITHAIPTVGFSTITLNGWIAFFAVEEILPLLLPVSLGVSLGVLLGHFSSLWAGLISPMNAVLVHEYRVQVQLGGDSLCILHFLVSCMDMDLHGFDGRSNCSLHIPEERKEPQRGTVKLGR